MPFGRPEGEEALENPAVGGCRRCKAKAESLRQKDRAGVPVIAALVFVDSSESLSDPDDGFLFCKRQKQRNEKERTT